MSEQIEDYEFTYKEVVEALIKQQGLHEGIWMLGMRFGIGPINVQSPTGGDPVPAAIVPVVGLSLRRKEALNPLALDAAVVNPAREKTKKKK